MPRERNTDQKSTRGGYVFSLPGYKKGINSSELEVLRNGRGLSSRLSTNKRYRNISKNELIAHLENTLRPVGEQALPLKEFRTTLTGTSVRIKLSRSEIKINGMLLYYKGFVFKRSDIDKAYAWASLAGRIAIPTLGAAAKQGKKQSINQEVANTGGVTHSPLIENILRHLGKYYTRTASNSPKPKRDEEDIEQRQHPPYL